MKRCPVSSFFCLFMFVCPLSRLLHSTRKLLCQNGLSVNKVRVFCIGFYYLRLCVRAQSKPSVLLRALVQGVLHSVEVLNKSENESTFGNDLKHGQLSVAGRPCIFPAHFFRHTKSTATFECLFRVQKVVFSGGCGMVSDVEA